MLKHHLTPMKSCPVDDRPISFPDLFPDLSLSGLAPRPSNVPRGLTARKVDHRNGAGHLDPSYESELRARVQDRARQTGDRAFVSRTSCTDRSAGEAAEEFVTIATSGGSEPFAYDEDTTDERGGPFVETRAGVEFAYGRDASNPPGATREPFPRS